ncbi:MAG: outer membrane protein assembly factor BamD (BamD/ComL family) [Zhongshania aliphaticivorans]|jgi:outer membrane protein assembly factor BamD (BamD/ComL family)|tara:strand:- start:3826 stop:4305 length:480 start_codon:yes stop_codon:yes gene_type:complete
MPLRLSCLTLLCTFVISACQTPPTPRTPEPIEIQTALQHLENKQYQAAATSFQAALNTGSERVSQQALAGLCLLHLQNQDIAAATSTLDELYQRALRKPQGDNSLQMLRISLQFNLESTLRLNLESQSRQAAEAKQQQLHNETLALQRALAKLRQLSLQ